MKALSINNVLPLMALLAVGCSSPLALQTTEHDDVYFSSSDQVTLPEAAVIASAGPVGERYSTETYAYDPQTGEPVNPDYVEGGTTGNATDEYRDESYGDVFVTQNVRPRYRMPFNQFGTSMVMMDPFFNPYFPMAHRSFMNPYWGPGMMYDPFYAYDPFFMPSARFGMGFGVGFGMGFGMGMGMGGFGMNPFMNPFMDPFGMHYGMMSPYGMSPWGYNRMMMNNYHMGYNHGLYRQYYANNTAFEPQRTVYAPRNARNVSPVTRGERAMTGRPEATGRARTEGRSGNYSPDAVGSQSAGRPARTVDARGGDTRSERVGERPALQNRPQRPQDQQARSSRSADAPQYRSQPGGTTTQQAPATRQQTRRAERVEYSRPARTQQAPARTTTPNYDRGTSSPSYSQPSYSRPSMSSPSGGSSAPSGGGRPSRR